MIFTGSRYTGTEVISPVAPNGTTPRVLATRLVSMAPAVLSHTVAEGERLDQLAARYYSEPTKSWLILDANPGVLNPFDLLAAGSAIAVPQNRIVRK
jgi:phage tail protein X